MTNYDDEITKKFGELNLHLEQLKAKQAVPFSENAVADFGRDFYITILGCLSFLQKNMTTHKQVICVTTCNQLRSHIITDGESYDSFADDLCSITPPIGVDFTFTLKDSLYSTADIQEVISVYFRDGGYEIVYLNNSGGNAFQRNKQYLQVIETSETLELRNLLSDRIINKALNAVKSHL